MVAATTPGSPFLGRKPEDLALENGRVFVKAEGAAKGVPFADVLRRANVRLVTGSGDAAATFVDPESRSSRKHSYRLPLRRSHLAAGDRPPASQPGGDASSMRDGFSTRWQAATRSRARW